MQGTVRRRGFTLTEILLAVGILGIGLTMVASVFPVAVDQTRRSTDATNAALCARSVAATMRALRPKFVNECRTYFAKNSTSTASSTDTPAEYDGPTGISPSIPRIPYSAGTAVTQAALKPEMREYNPNSFLYEQGTGTLASAKFRQYFDDPALKGALPTLATGETYEKKRPYSMPQWYMGNYVPVIYISPMTTLQTERGTATSKSNRSNPFRITIVVFRSRGSSGTGALGSTGLHPRNKPITQLITDKKLPAPGDYVLDRNRCCGECYLIDSVSLLGSTWKITVGSSGLYNTPSAIAPPSIPTTGTSYWYTMPGAVAVYHTVIGD